MASAMNNNYIADDPVAMIKSYRRTGGGAVVTVARDDENDIGLASWRFTRRPRATREIKMLKATD